MTRADSTDLTDPRIAYFGATEWVMALLRSVREDQLDLPTPCSEFDVRTLSSHLIATVERLVAIAEFGSPDSISPISGDHDAASFEKMMNRARVAWADDALLDASITAPWGEAPGRSAVWGYANEALVHGWDLAVATGQPAEADPEIVEPTAAVFRSFLSAEARVPGVPFGAVVEPRHDAGPTERLANFSGRSSQGWV